MNRKCCASKTVSCFKKLSQLDIELARDEYLCGNETQQNQFVLDYLRRNKKHSDNSVLYSIAGQEVCELAWRLAYGIRRNRFKRLFDKFTDGVMQAEHGRLGMQQSSSSSLRMTSWMRVFFAKVGDKMPMNDNIHLPSCLTKIDVYNIAMDELNQGSMNFCVSLSNFYSIWAKHFPEVKIPEVHLYKLFMIVHVVSSVDCTIFLSFLFWYRKAGFLDVTFVLLLKKQGKEL